jgi:hypothetical protein
MNTDFNTVLDDDSALEVARHLVYCYDLYKNHNFTQLEAEINKLDEKLSNKQSSIKMTQDDDDDDDDDDEVSD